MKKNERLLESLSLIDDKYIKDAEPKNKRRSRGLSRDLGIGKLVRMVAAFAIIIGLGFYLFMPFRVETIDASAYRGSEYFSLIEELADVKNQANRPRFNNNFEVLVSLLDFGVMMDGVAPSPDEMEPTPPTGAIPEEGASGEYVEITDNQVAGVIEGDLMKRTSTHIFRLGMTNGIYKEKRLYIYSINKEASTLISSFAIPTFDGEEYTVDAEMYLSSDGRTVTVVKQYMLEGSRSKLGVLAIDVSDPERPVQKAEFSMDGYYDTSRMAGGKLILVTNHRFNIKEVDFDKPETFVPTVNTGDGDDPISFENIIYPETIETLRYRVVALLDAENLELLGANALLNFTNSLYISENNIYITREAYEAKSVSDTETVKGIVTEAAILGYSDAELTYKGSVSFFGSVLNQYSMDELDGYFRVVATTEKYIVHNDKGTSPRFIESASLYVFSLADNSLVASVDDFAPDGEEVTSVRFDKNDLYVCTARIVTFTDPVFFFDLSDYNNITYTDTGVIDGFSTSLINIGEGFLLGIGEENWQYSKVEVYEEGADSVISVDAFRFEGAYSTEYKSYLVDRDNNLFGFGVNQYYNEEKGAYENTYILLAFDGYKLHKVAEIEMRSGSPELARAFFEDGYLYLTDYCRLNVIKVFETSGETIAD